MAEEGDTRRSSQDLSDQPTEIAANQHVSDKSIHVGWDGDKDPMCPRSMSRMRKWLIVSIACVGSLCV
ncbi:unnamed protein product, partial [Fusarium langsethiae]